MGMKRDPAVRLCVTCGQLSQPISLSRVDTNAWRVRVRGPGALSALEHGTTPMLSIHARARDQALRRLGQEHLNAYRKHYQAEGRAIPSTGPADLARKRAVSRALRAVERQHRPRYGELYQQELKRTRSQRHPRRPGRPAGIPNRLTIASEPASTWQPNGAGGRPSHQKEEEEVTTQRAKLQAIRERAAELFAEAALPPPSPTNSTSPDRPRPSGGPAGNPVAPPHCETEGSAASPRFPTASCRRSSGSY